MQTDCLFCQIIAGEEPAHIVWEDENHLAFLSIFPNTKGVTVVVPKKHHPSYIYDMEDEGFFSLFSAARAVAKLLESKLDGVGRVALAVEGFGIDHAHIKLFPLHGTHQCEWKSIASRIDKYFVKYEGYVSTHDAERADDQGLKALAAYIRS